MPVTSPMRALLLRTALLVVLPLLLVACATPSPPSTVLPDSLACPVLPPVPASLRGSATKPYVPGQLSQRAATDINSWREMLTAPLTPASSAATPR